MSDVSCLPSSLQQPEEGSVTEDKVETKRSPHLLKVTEVSGGEHELLFSWEACAVTYLSLEFFPHLDFLGWLC
jgi:hypothetical protein